MYAHPMRSYIYVRVCKCEAPAFVNNLLRGKLSHCGEQYDLRCCLVHWRSCALEYSTQASESQHPKSLVYRRG